MTTGKRKSERSTRRKLRSPGRPGVARQSALRSFWLRIALGLSSEDAAVEIGLSQPVGTRWFRDAGGMPPTHLALSTPSPSLRYLCLEEREEIALLLAQNIGMREIARRLGRAASTISREVRRNAATRSGGFDYRATTAQWHAERSAKRPKIAKLVTHAALRQYVQDRLSGHISLLDGSGVVGPQISPLAWTPTRPRRAGGGGRCLITRGKTRL